MFKAESSTVRCRSRSNPLYSAYRLAHRLDGCPICHQMVQDEFVYVYRLGTTGERLVGVGIAKGAGIVLEEQDREFDWRQIPEREMAVRVGWDCKNLWIRSHRRCPTNRCLW